MRNEILKMLENNSRIDLHDLAIMLGTDESMVLEEIEKMENEGIICGYPTLINWDKTDTEKVTAFIEVRVTPQRGSGFDEIAERIYKFEEVKAVYDQYYAKEKFVRVLDRDVCPETKWVEGSNYVDIGFKIDPRTNRIIMMGAIDNLVKGAAGQAVQNMNLLFGLPEDEGLELVTMFP